MPIAKLKRPPRKPILESSDEEDNIPLSVTAKYGGLRFYDIDSPLNGFPSAVNGFTLEDNCCVLWKLNEDASEKPVKGYGI